MKSILLLAVGLLLSAASVRDQGPKLLKDINTVGLPNPSSNLGVMSSQPYRAGGYDVPQIGPLMFLQATTKQTGAEIWSSDGTQAGTRLLRDINPGPASGDPTSMAVTNDGKRAFFAADDGMSGKELWMTDGSSAGTVLVKDIFKGSDPSSIGEIMAFGPSSVMFRANDGQTGIEIYISDGTSSGTKMLKDIHPATSYPQHFRATADGKLVFFSADDGTSGIELWVTDGTSVGTRLVKDINPGGSKSRPEHPVPLGSSRVVFTASDGKTGAELWVSDGTSAGTNMVIEINKGPIMGATTAYAVSLGNKVLFGGHTTATAMEMYVTDGTAKGTKLLLDANPGSEYGYGYGPQLDSTRTRAFWMTPTGSTGLRLFVTDGTVNGTQMFSPVPLGRGLASRLVELGGKIYFTATDLTPGTGNELCVCDGTAAGTRVVRDTAPGGLSSNTFVVSPVNKTSLLYVADDTVHGREPWVMSSTGNHQLLDIHIPPPGDTQSAHPLGIARFGKHVVFSAFDGVSGTETWISDGSTQGTRLLKDLVPGITSSLSHYYAVAGDKLVFDAYTPATGMELFVTDGTPSGTRLLRDIRSGSASSYPSYLASVGDKVYFSCNDGSAGFEPWVTDGTPTVTRMLRDLYPGSLSSSPHSFAGMGQRVVFSAVAPNGRSGIYLTDGTQKGTRLLKAIGASGMVFSGGLIYFSSSVFGRGRELWVSDFTSQGTVMVLDLMPGMESGLLSGPSAGNGLAYFCGYTPSTGAEIFVSNGTAAGTRLYLESRPGSQGSFTKAISTVGSRKVYYIGYTQASGRETMVTDGTIAGTRALDVYPGASSGAASFKYSPVHRAVLGNQVFFPSLHPRYGLEIFTVDNGATAEPLGTPYGSTWIVGDDPVLGRTAWIQGLTSLANPVHMTVMGSLRAKPLAFGNHSWLHIDLGSYFSVAAATPGRQISHSIAIPNIQALKGLQLVFQTLAFDSTNFLGSFELSNGLHWTLGN